MGALGFFLAVVACAIIVKLSNWWDNRKEEKERQRIITMNQDAAARQIMNDTFERSKNVMEQTKGSRELFLETLSKEPTEKVQYVNLINDCTLGRDIGEC